MTDSQTTEYAGRRYAHCRHSDLVGRRYHHGASRFSQDGRRYYECCLRTRVTVGRRYRIEIDLSGERAAEWDTESLTELCAPEYAATVRAWAERELTRRQGYRGTGTTRAALLAMWRESIELQYLAAEAECNGQLLKPAARLAGISARSLFTGPARRAELYASEELLWFWTRNPRLTFDAWLGDSDAATAAAVGF